MHKDAEVLTVEMRSRIDLRSRPSAMITAFIDVKPHSTISKLVLNGAYTLKMRRLAKIVQSKLNEL